MGKKVVVISSKPESLSEFLRDAGYKVKECLSTDLAEKVANDAETIIYTEDVTELKTSHYDALKQLISKQIRIVLVAKNTSELVPYAAALGIKDFVFLPTTLAQVLYRIEHPTTGTEAAEQLRERPGNKEPKKVLTWKTEVFQDVDMLIEHLKNTKKPVTVISTCLDMLLLLNLGLKNLDEESLWQHDWRVRTAKPLKVSRKVEVYISEDGDIEDRDITVLEELIAEKIKNKRQVIIYAKGGEIFDLCKRQ